MKHVAHAIRGIVLVLVASIPAILADPAVRSLIVHHPAVALYVPAAVGIVDAIAHALTSGGDAAPSTSSSLGSGGSS